MSRMRLLMVSGRTLNRTAMATWGSARPGGGWWPGVRSARVRTERRPVPGAASRGGGRGACRGSSPAAGHSGSSVAVGPRRRTSSRIASRTPAGSRTRNVAAMPAPHWFFRFMYDRESAAWERRRNELEHRELVERVADELANVVASPGPVADLGCGPGTHALALARRGYDVVGVDGSRRMVEVTRTRAARDKVDATFDVHDVSAPRR
jgi:hypothetical protein